MDVERATRQTVSRRRRLHRRRVAGQLARAIAKRRPRVVISCDNLPRHRLPSRMFQKTIGTVTAGQHVGGSHGTNWMNTTVILGDLECIAFQSVYVVCYWPGAIGSMPALAGDQLNAGMANTPNNYPSFLVAGSDRVAYYNGTADDLLTAGLGKTGLTLAAPVVSDPQDVTQLRRLAIYTNYRALVDIAAAGGYGTLYGPNVTNSGVVTASEGKIAGWEYIATVDDGSGRQNAAGHGPDSGLVRSRQSMHRDRGRRPARAAYMERSAPRANGG